jgi:hypothetical protein
VTVSSSALKLAYPVHAATRYEQEAANLLIAHMRIKKRERGKLAGACFKVHCKGRGILLTYEEALEERVLGPEDCDTPP